MAWRASSAVEWPGEVGDDVGVELELVHPARASPTASVTIGTVRRLVDRCRRLPSCGAIRGWERPEWRSWHAVDTHQIGMKVLVAQSTFEVRMQ